MLAVFMKQEDCTHESSRALLTVSDKVSVVDKASYFHHNIPTK